MTFILILINVFCILAGITIPLHFFIEHGVRINIHAPIFYGAFRNPQSARRYIQRFGLLSAGVLCVLYWTYTQHALLTGDFAVIVAVLYLLSVFAHHPYCKSTLSGILPHFLYEGTMWGALIGYAISIVYLAYALSLLFAA